jgi:hypothetical protein
MEEISPVRTLEGLLSETPAQARARLSAHARLFDGAPIVLYGAGTLGREMAARLGRSGVVPACFADDTPAKQGRNVDGIPIWSTQQAVERAGANARFVVTILNPALSFRDARKRLEPIAGAGVFSFLDLAWLYPETCLPWYSFRTARRLTRKSARDPTNIWPLGRRRIAASVRRAREVSPALEHRRVAA